jgi:hypothetical protein
MKMRSKAACMIGAFAALAMLAGCSEPEAKAYKLGPVTFDRSTMHQESAFGINVFGVGVLTAQSSDSIVYSYEFLYEVSENVFKPFAFSWSLHMGDDLGRSVPVTFTYDAQAEPSVSFADAYRVYSLAFTLNSKAQIATLS